MSQSKLVNLTMLTSHIGYPDGKKGRGGAKIDKIFVHHMAGILTAKQCGNVFKSRPASAHYGIGSDGKIGQYVLEENTAWHCASKSYNQRSIGIELSNDKGASGGWHVADKTIAKCIDLIVDICQRNDIKKINYTGDLKGNLCMHRWTASTSCPGPYLSKKFKYIAEQVNKKLNAKPTPKPTVEHLYRVRKTWKDAKSQIGAYRSLENAKKACKVGYSVFDETGKAVYTPKSPSKTKQDLMCEWAKHIANDTKYHYVKWNGKNKKTQTCPICMKRKYDDAYGGNCIWLPFASWHHGAKLDNNCSCGVIADSEWNAMLKAKTDAEALKIAQKCIGLKDVKVIRNGGKAIPQSKLSKGDVIAYYDGSKFLHAMLYVGNGKMAECTSSKTPNIGYGRKCPTVKVAIRYIGK